MKPRSLRGNPNFGFQSTKSLNETEEVDLPYTVQSLEIEREYELMIVLNRGELAYVTQKLSRSSEFKKVKLESHLVIALSVQLEQVIELKEPEVLCIEQSPVCQLQFLVTLEDRKLKPGDVLGERRVDVLDQHLSIHIQQSDDSGGGGVRKLFAVSTIGPESPNRLSSGFAVQRRRFGRFVEQMQHQAADLLARQQTLDARERAQILRRQLGEANVMLDRTEHFAFVLVGRVQAELLDLRLHPSQARLQHVDLVHVHPSEVEQIDQRVLVDRFEELAFERHLCFPSNQTLRSLQQLLVAADLHQLVVDDTAVRLVQNGVDELDQAVVQIVNEILVAGHVRLVELCKAELFQPMTVDVLDHVPEASR